MGMLRLRLRLALLFVICCGFWMALGAAVMAFVHQAGVGATLGLLFGVGYWMLASLASERFVLEAYGAQVLGELWAPDLCEVVRELSLKARILPPILYNIPLSAPNAFALGRKDGGPVIVVTNGLTKQLTPAEVRAVMALMIARLNQPESLAWPLAATVAGMPLYGVCQPALRDFLRKFLPVDGTGLTPVDRVLMFVATPLSAFALWLVCDRQSVAEADTAAAHLLGGSEALESALHKIEDRRPQTWWGKSPYNPATAMLFAVPPIAKLDGLDGDAEQPFFRQSQATVVAPLPTTDERRQNLFPESH
jgi:Zn-dependent protease with chaperone function